MKDIHRFSYKKLVLTIGPGGNLSSKKTEFTELSTRCKWSQAMFNDTSSTLSLLTSKIGGNWWSGATTFYEKLKRSCLEEKKVSIAKVNKQNSLPLVFKVLPKKFLFHYSHCMVLISFQLNTMYQRKTSHYSDFEKTTMFQRVSFTIF